MKQRESVDWSKYFSSAKVAHYAGWRTYAAICESCGESTSCHRRVFDGDRCISCDEENS